MPPLREVERFLEYLLSIYPGRWSDATIRFVLATATSVIGLEAYLDEVEWRLAELAGEHVAPAPPPSNVRLRRG